MASFRRRPKFETLENRWLMATDLGQITGTVLNELQNDANVGNNAAVSGLTVQLYRDNGNSSFNSASDTLVTTTTTNGAGAYTFNNITEGSYFVRILPSSTLQVLAGGDVSSLISFNATEVMGSTNLTVDNFASAQSVSVTRNSGDPATVANSAADGASASGGGVRDLFTQITGNTGTMTLDSATTLPATLTLASGPGVRGLARVVWDGTDGDGATVSRNGLSLDFNNAGVNSGILLAVSADNKPNSTVTVRLSSSNTRISTATVPIVDQDGLIDGDATESIFIPWSSFSPATGSASGVDLADVGAVELEFDFTNGQSDGFDGVATLVGVIGLTVKTANFTTYPRMSLGDQVWIDIDNDGMFMAPEVGVNGVTVNLYRDTNTDGDYDSGVDQFLASTSTNPSGQYLFTDLLPGDYLVGIPQTMFGANQPLAGLTSSTGNNTSGVAPDPDTDSNSKDKGDLIAGQGVFAKTITLVGNTEPTSDGDQDTNSNRTVDFGFFGLDIQVDKTVSAATIDAGGTLTYTVQVRNNGPATATGVTLVDTLPSGVTYQSSGTTPAPATVAGQTLTYNLGTMVSGAMQTFTILATVNSNASGTLVNSAVVSANETEALTTNNADTAQTVLNSRVGRLTKRRFLASST